MPYEYTLITFDFLGNSLFDLVFDVILVKFLPFTNCFKKAHEYYNYLSSYRIGIKKGIIRTYINGKKEIF